MEQGRFRNHIDRADLMGKYFTGFDLFTDRRLGNAGEFGQLSNGTAVPQTGIIAGIVNETAFGRTEFFGGTGFLGRFTDRKSVV